MESLPPEILQFIAYDTNILDPTDVLALSSTSTTLRTRLLSDEFTHDLFSSLFGFGACGSLKTGRWRAARMALARSRATPDDIAELHNSLDLPTAYKSPSVGAPGLGLLLAATECEPRLVFLVAAASGSLPTLKKTLPNVAPSLPLIALLWAGFHNQTSVLAFLLDVLRETRDHWVDDLAPLSPTYDSLIQMAHQLFDPDPTLTTDLVPLVSSLLNLSNSSSSPDNITDIRVDTLHTLCEILSFFTSSFPALTLSAPVLLALWDALWSAEPPASDDDVTRFASWMNSSHLAYSSDPPLRQVPITVRSPTFSPSALATLFTSRVLPLVAGSPGSYPAEMCTLFCTGFLISNAVSGALCTLDPFSSPVLVDPASLVGLDTLAVLAYTSSELARSLLVYVLTTPHAPSGLDLRALASLAFPYVSQALAQGCPLGMSFVLGLVLKNPVLGDRIASSPPLVDAIFDAFAANVSDTTESETGGGTSSREWEVLLALPTLPHVALAMTAPLDPDALVPLLTFVPSSNARDDTHSLVRILYVIHTLGEAHLPALLEGATPGASLAPVADALAALLNVESFASLCGGISGAKRAVAVVLAHVGTPVHDVSSLSSILMLLRGCVDLAKKVGSTSKRGRKKKVTGRAGRVRWSPFRPLVNRAMGCLYSTRDERLQVVVRGTSRFRMSMYCVDFNTTRRNQTVSVWAGRVGEDGSVLDARPTGVESVRLDGPLFHNGVWLVWDVALPECGEGEDAVVFLDMMNKGKSPNWVLSAILLDPLVSSASPSSTLATTPVGASLVDVDYVTMGTWHGVYGSCGGRFISRLGLEDVPSSVERSPGIPWLEDLRYSKQSVLAYSWQYYLSSDVRSLQLPPLPMAVMASCDQEWDALMSRMAVMKDRTLAHPEPEAPPKAQPPGPSTGTADDVDDGVLMGAVDALAMQLIQRLVDKSLTGGGTRVADIVDMVLTLTHDSPWSEDLRTLWTHGPQDNDLQQPWW